MQALQTTNGQRPVMDVFNKVAYRQWPDGHETLAIDFSYADQQTAQEQLDLRIEQLRRWGWIVNDYR